MPIKSLVQDIRIQRRAEGLPGAGGENGAGSSEIGGFALFAGLADEFTPEAPAAPVGWELITEAGADPTYWVEAGPINAGSAMIGEPSIIGADPPDPQSPVKQGWGNFPQFVQ